MMLLGSAAANSRDSATHQITGCQSVKQSAVMMKTKAAYKVILAFDAIQCKESAPR